tara:strand:+ start:13474 stop:14829 length:1356 start_codon:yes stop_codon:yes gene_type:complete
MTQSSVSQPLYTDQNRLTKHPVNVHKFGGSSLATSQCIERVIDIIRNNCQLNDIIVVSANGNTTDTLFTLSQIALDNEEKTSSLILKLQQQQSALINDLLNQHNAKRLNIWLADDIKQLTIWLKSSPQKYNSDILAFGELWSARLLSTLIIEKVCPSYHIDAREFLVINNEHECNLDHFTSLAQLRNQQQQGKLAVITGYITKDKQGKNCTLGRNGSDYTATIMASLLGALNVTLWTDVNGIYSADPRLVANARMLHRFSNDAAKELARLGNSVLHTKTLHPLTDHSTYLHVASSFNAKTSGTKIGNFTQLTQQEFSVTFLNDLLLAQSDNLKGHSGVIAGRELSAVFIDTRQGYIVISQAHQTETAKWLTNHNAEVIFSSVSIIAMVAHDVAKHHDVKTRFKRALKTAQPFKLADSTSDHSLVAVLPTPCTSELLNSVHHEMTKGSPTLV